MNSWITKIIQYVKRPSWSSPDLFLKWKLDMVMDMLSSRPELDQEFLFKKTLIVSFLSYPYRISEFRAISISGSTFTPHHIMLKIHHPFLKVLTDVFSPSPIIIPIFPLFLSCNSNQ